MRICSLGERNASTVYTGSGAGWTDGGRLLSFFSGQRDDEEVEDVTEVSEIVGLVSRISRVIFATAGNVFLRDVLDGTCK